MIDIAHRTAAVRPTRRGVVILSLLPLVLGSCFGTRIDSKQTDRSIEVTVTSGVADGLAWRLLARRAKARLTVVLVANREELTIGPGASTDLLAVRARAAKDSGTAENSTIHFIFGWTRGDATIIDIVPQDAEDQTRSLSINTIHVRGFNEGFFVTQIEPIMLRTRVEAKNAQGRVIAGQQLEATPTLG